MRKLNIVWLDLYQDEVHNENCDYVTFVRIESKVLRPLEQEVVSFGFFFGLVNLAGRLCHNMFDFCIPPLS